MASSKGWKVGTVDRRHDGDVVAEFYDEKGVYPVAFSVAGYRLHHLDRYTR